MFQDINKHKNFCLQCQQCKKSTDKKTPLVPLPIPKQLNLWIHADLFGPVIMANSHKKIVLCITDAYTKYAVVTAIANKDAETVADAIYKEWFSKFGILAQIHTDRESICQQAFGRTIPASQCQPHQDFSSASIVQCPGQSFQQNGEKIYAIFCQ
jgi:hypothetical protein